MPLYVYVARKTMNDKKFIINMNNYRNQHRFTENSVKRAYKDTVEPLLKHVDKLKNISLVFTLYKGSKRLSDRANVLSIHEKYICDALVELGYLSDDNDDFIDSQHYFSGGIDKINPRVEMAIIVNPKFLDKIKLFIRKFK